MFPVLVNSSGLKSAPRSVRLLSVGLAIIFSVGVAMLLIPDAGDTPLLAGVIAFALALIGGSVVLMLTQRTTAAKGKRGLEGLDIYSVMDRLVDDLDDDEAAYLQRRLDQRELKAKNDLTDTVDELLDQRESERRGQSHE